MNNSFWELISRSKAHGEEQVEWLVNELAKQKTDDIYHFEIEFKDKMNQSYTSSLWGAAFVIMGGCSDDGFDYFRGWLISRGEDVFYKAIKNPEYLAQYLTEDNLHEDVFAPQLEEILHAASNAYTFQKSGSFEYDDMIHSDFFDELEAKGYNLEPIDIDLDWEEEDLKGRYPLLWERFGDNPLT